MYMSRREMKTTFEESELKYRDFGQYGAVQTSISRSRTVRSKIQPVGTDPG